VIVYAKRLREASVKYPYPCKVLANY